MQHRRILSAVDATLQSLLTKTTAAWLLVATLLLPSLVHAQGFPQRVFSPGELVMTLFDEDGRKSRVAYHQGYLYTLDQNTKKARLWSIADENNPTMLRTFDEVYGSHGFGRTGDVLVMTAAAAVRAPTEDASNPQRFQFARSFGSDREYYFPWMMTHHDGYGSPSGTLILGNARSGEVYSRPNPLAEAGVAGKAIMIGNLLIYASLHSTSGVATYDISDPRNPVLLDVLPNIGAYEPAVYGHLLTMAVGFNNRDLHGGGGFDRGITFVDFSDPRDLKIVGRMESNELAGDHRYMQFQDEYMFVGRTKVDMNTRQKVLEFDAKSDLVDYLLPIGHLVVLGQQIHGDTEIFAHQGDLDTRPPTVAYHLPVDGAVNQATTSRIGIIIHETLDTTTLVNGSTLIVRPVGGQSIEGDVFVSDMDIITFTPSSPLLADTTYEVILTANGVEDVAGNAIEGYSFRFSTGNSIDDGNEPPSITQMDVSAYPASIGQSVRFTATASDPDGDALEYRFDFGDGSDQTAWLAANTTSHTYRRNGHFRAQVQVRDPRQESVVSTRVVTVATPPSQPGSNNSSPIILDTEGRRIWTVNPDNNSVTALDTNTLRVVSQTAVGDTPRSLAQSPDGRIWITAQGDDRIDVLNPSTGEVETRIQFAYGSAPYGVVFSPVGESAFVSLEGRGSLVRMDANSLAVTGRLSLGAHARALAISADGGRIYVTRFNSPQDHGIVWDVDALNMSLTNTIQLAKDPGPDTDLTGRGIPNYLAGITIHPDGKRAWVASKKDNIDRGELRDGNKLTFENTTRTILSAIDVGAGKEVLTERIDSDNNDSLVAIEFAPLGDYAFVAVQGTNRVEIIDTFTNARVTQIDTGAAPQGLRFDPNTNRLFVKDFLGRSVTVYDTQRFLRRGDISFPSPRTIKTVEQDTLTAQQLLGKKVFYNAGDPRMSQDGYLSCASCHVDGDSDGRVWDFTDRGEGLRNTKSLRGKAGLLHGRLHWSANFDEIQDFENDIRSAFGGTGFMSNADFASRSNPLGSPKAGISRELDGLAAYVSSLTKTPRSPYRNTNGSLTDDGKAGRILFSELGCVSCHSGKAFTDSSTGALHDVGTLKPSSGKRSGQDLTGLDTPSLLGLWQTPPYLHDGSAATLSAVVTTSNPDDAHGKTSNLSATQRRQLELFLLQIDDNEPAVSPDEGDDITITMQDSRAVESSGTAQIELKLSRASTNAATVTVFNAIAGSTATQGEDFYGFSQLVTFEPGETSQSVLVAIRNDVNAESDETINVRLVRPTGAALASDSGVITIVDDDDGSTPQLSISNQTIDEGAGVARLVVSLMPASTETVGVRAFTRATGTAVPGEDYYGLTVDLEFAPGQTQAIIPMQVLDDANAERVESLSLFLIQSQGAPIAKSSATIEITDDD